MKNDITIGNCRLIKGDCLEIMRDLPPVAHVLADPPYEDDMHNAKSGCRGTRTDGGKDLEGLNFSSISEIREEATALMAGLCQGWMILFCTPEGVKAWRDTIEQRRRFDHLGAVLEAGKPLARYKRACVWVKPDAAPQFNGQGPAMAAENIVTAWCAPGISKWNSGGKRGFYIHNTNQPDRDGQHPTEKPLPLMMELINDFTLPGDTVLDPFMGSATTALACMKLGRKFIGIEMSPEYFDLAVRRVEAVPGSGKERSEPPEFSLKYVDANQSTK